MKRAIAIAVSTTMIMALLGLLMFVEPAAAQEVVATPESAIALRANAPDAQWVGSFLYTFTDDEFDYVGLVRFDNPGVVNRAVVGFDYSYVSPVRSFIYRSSASYDSATVSYNSLPQVYELIYTDLLTSPRRIEFDVTNQINRAYP
ncbi:MAG: hypothetical protein KDD89_01510, partial [Anaerolineales bacterium]|nr:hypothetical protein [Anaerolineales bacterium]